jgi:hypothetical protein
MSALLRRSWQVAQKTFRPTSVLPRLSKRYFEAPQEDDEITEIQPFLGTGQYWADTASLLKSRLGEE